MLLVTPVARAQDADVVEEIWTDETPQPRDVALFRSTMMRDHNTLRQSYGVPPLTWDDALAAHADYYARTLAATHRFQHAARVAGKPVEGENLWMGTRSAYAYHDMTGAWIEEGEDFMVGRFPEISRTGSWHDIGHFTQMIWAGTRAVGCGLAANADYEYLVCRYFPAGNVMGELVLEPYRSRVSSQP
jgi:Cysteine-rich secretory protein family